MKIIWKITKKQGNWRPVLEYVCQKEPWEIELKIPGGEVKNISIFVPANSQAHCFAGENERNEQEKELGHIYKRNLQLPSSETVVEAFDHILLWRKDNDYSDVEETLRLLMKEWEKRVQEAINSAEIEKDGEIGHTPEFKQVVAAFVARYRMLNSKKK